MSDSWGHNPYPAYTQKHDAWERQQAERRAVEDQRYRDSLESVSTMFGQTEGATYGGGGSNGASASGGGSPLDSLIHAGDWCVQHLWPLRVLKEAGEQLAQVGWYIRLPAIVVGAVVAAALTVFDDGPGAWPWASQLLNDIAGDMAVLVALAVGAFLGWIMFPVAGVLLMFSALLTGVAIVSGLIAGFCWVAYMVIMTWMSETA